MLACLSGFCDVVIVSDQASTDGSREIYPRFPKVKMVDRIAFTARTMAATRRWHLLDAAREYDGKNLLWCIDADELVSPALMRAWLSAPATRLEPGTFLECGYYQLWNRHDTYRDDGSAYAPQLKMIGFVDDRIADFDRSPDVRVEHESRVPFVEGARSLAAPELPWLHLQWLLPEYNQIKQAWYRCRELLDDRQTAVAINESYAHTMLSGRPRTTPVARAWLEGLTFPDFDAVDRKGSWHLAEILQFFDRHGVERFEPLEIWNIPALEREFRARAGRRPHPDRSYLPPWHDRARRATRRAAGRVWRRVFA
jgi:hypothetical protein